MIRHRVFALILISVFLLPPIVVAVNPTPDLQVENVDEIPWWETTNMDLDRDRIHDAIPLAAAGGGGGGWLDSENTISVIVDFDHLPSEDDELMLEERLHFQTQFRYHLIHSMAGRIPLEYVNDLVELPGVVFVELDGRLTIAMDHVVESHGVTQVWEDTGYTGAGSVVSIIDTGIDGTHVGLDDLDDDNSTNDSKIIGFYDAVNSPELTNGTEVFPYDDQGHGTHCAGITAGTGAPDFAYVGVAPQAQLVGVKVLDEGGSGSFATVMAGMEWTVDHRHDFNIRAASMSLGGPGAIEWTSSEEESVNRMGNEMMRDGVALFIAAGNSAVSAQIGTPGSAEDVITVGALDKNEGDPGSNPIAVYSSQGPTEENRIKPNIAFVGSNVMAPDFNTGDGYTGKSGTSMATPGAAGVAALMYQANPDISPFDVRNIMQETATYRECHYMFANEPCPFEDGLPKNRQNNVYGHGHVNALPSVMEAANKVYGINLDLNVTLLTNQSVDNKVHMHAGDQVEFSLEGSPVLVQWRTWDMRDNWMDHSDYEPGEDVVSITHEMLVERLEYLPGNTIIGNQTLMVRAILGDNASANAVVHISIEDSEPLMEIEESSFFDSKAILLVSGSLFGILIAVVAVFAGIQQGIISKPDFGYED
jgi:subtilisin family serine protease